METRSRAAALLLLALCGAGAASAAGQGRRLLGGGSRARELETEVERTTVEAFDGSKLTLADTYVPGQRLNMLLQVEDDAPGAAAYSWQMQNASRAGCGARGAAGQCAITVLTGSFYRLADPLDYVYVFLFPGPTRDPRRGEQRLLLPLPPSAAAAAAASERCSHCPCLPTCPPLPAAPCASAAVGIERTIAGSLTYTVYTEADFPLSIPLPGGAVDIGAAVAGKPWKVRGGEFVEDRGSAGPPNKELTACDHPLPTTSRSSSARRRSRWKR